MRRTEMYRDVQRCAERRERKRDPRTLTCMHLCIPRAGLSRVPSHVLTCCADVTGAGRAGGWKLQVRRRGHPCTRGSFERRQRHWLALRCGRGRHPEAHPHAGRAGRVHRRSVLRQRRRQRPRRRWAWGRASLDLHVRSDRCGGRSGSRLRGSPTRRDPQRCGHIPLSERGEAPGNTGADVVLTWC